MLPNSQASNPLRLEPSELLANFHFQGVCFSISFLHLYFSMIEKRDFYYQYWIELNYGRRYWFFDFTVVGVGKINDRRRRRAMVECAMGGCT